MSKLRKLVCFILLFSIPVQAALTIDPATVTDWTAVAQNTVVESATITCSSNYLTVIHIQGFLDSTTAHTGTEFIPQVSSADSGDEDWQDFGGRFIALVGTADSENITDNPLIVGRTSITVADTGGAYETYPMAHWIAIEDSTLINSELVLQTAYVSNGSITILDGTTNEHAQNTTMYDIAFTKIIIFPIGTNRARLIVNNTYDDNGSTLNYKVREIETTGL